MLCEPPARCGGPRGGARCSPLQRYCRLDQMMFSWEKQKTPSRPPRMVVSMITPESATSRGPSYSRTLREGRGRSAGHRDPNRDPTGHPPPGLGRGAGDGGTGLGDPAPGWDGGSGQGPDPRPGAPRCGRAGAPRAAPVPAPPPLSGALHVKGAGGRRGRHGDGTMAAGARRGGRARPAEPPLRRPPRRDP